MTDPDTSDTGDIILSVICAILALPLTILIGIVVLGIYLSLKLHEHEKRNK